MNFRNGYLGCCIVVLGIMITIVSSYALSIEISDVEETRYSYVTDLNGLFDSEQAPTYINYNPSTNYTGYYTVDSIIGNTKYFDGVNYDKSGQPNAFWINAMPENYSSGSFSTMPEGISNHQQITIYGTIEDGQGRLSTATVSARVQTVTLSAFITAMGLSNEVNLIEIHSLDNKDAIEWPYDGPYDVDWVIFSLSSEWYNSDRYADYYSTAYNELYNVNKQPPRLSAKIDLTDNSVYLYYDNECVEQAGIVNLADVLISYQDPDYQAPSLVIGDSIDYTAQTKNGPFYMNVKGGVEVVS